MNFNILLSEAVVIGMSESRLDDSVLSSEIEIENYDLISDFGVSTAILNPLDIFRRWWKLNFRLL